MLSAYLKHLKPLKNKVSVLQIMISICMYKKLLFFYLAFTVAISFIHLQWELQLRVLPNKSEGDSVGNRGGNHCDVDRRGDICHTNKRASGNAIDSFQWGIQLNSWIKTSLQKTVIKTTQKATSNVSVNWKLHLMTILFLPINANNEYKLSL